MTGVQTCALPIWSIDGCLAGATRASRLLYLDDLVSNSEEALNPDRLDKLWTQFTSDARSRKIGKCKELHIGTRWSLNDPIGRVERLNEGSDRMYVHRIPALNDERESNFDYPFNLGFTTEYFLEQEKYLDD